MSDYGGFIWVIDETRRGDELEGYIERNGTFTDTISASDWKTKNAEVFLISLDARSIHFASLARLGNKVATQKRIIRLSNFFKFEPAISIEGVNALLSASVKRHFARSSTGLGSRVPPKTWGEVISAIKRLQPSSAKSIDRIHELRQITPQLLDKPGAHIFIQERDAINLSLRIADIDPVQITDWSHPQGDSLAPFLHGLQNAVLTEDQMIAHDAEVFGDWKKISRYMVGAAIFRKGQEHLTVMNVNRHAIERTAGVDLIYYFHEYDS